uniref:ORF88.2 n=1 Tax=Leptospirillum ferrooxidans TaxID=180 RepID=Q58KB6_9BACT|nr:ORF88.2 [Leptospirillum ferrooxidans]
MRSDGVSLARGLPLNRPARNVCRRKIHYGRVFRNHPVVFLKNGNREENPSFGMAYFDRMGLSGDSEGPEGTSFFWVPANKESYVNKPP